MVLPSRLSERMSRGEATSDPDPYSRSLRASPEASAQRVRDDAKGALSRSRHPPCASTGPLVRNLLPSRRHHAKEDRMLKIGLPALAGGMRVSDVMTTEVAFLETSQ